MNFKLRLDPSKQQDSTQNDFAHEILNSHFQYLDKFDVIHRVAELHVTYQLQVAKMVTILRPLSKVCNNFNFTAILKLLLASCFLFCFLKP